MVHMEVNAWFAQDSLKGILFYAKLKRTVILISLLSGDNVTELRVKFVKKIEDTVPAGED